MGLPYSKFSNGSGQESIVVFDPTTAEPYVATVDHPNWTAILNAVDSDDENVFDLFDVSKVIDKKFRALSERVSVRNGRIYLDGDEVNNVLTEQILRFLDEDADFEPLVKFYDRLAQNPNQESVDQLYRWLQSHDFTITSDGKIIGYKGVESDGKGGFRSVKAGSAVVNGVEVTGQIPNNLGDVVEMPRSAVTFDPGMTCSYGLHVGTWDYALDWGRNGAVLKVLVDPRDVVSVPSDHGGAKLRTCRYKVLEVIEQKVNNAMVVIDDMAEEDPGYDCDNCGAFVEFSDDECTECEPQDYDYCEVCEGPHQG
jgi:hypothetical protein